MKHIDRQYGFTLIELLVVIAIIAMLVSILLPSLNTAKMLAKITKTHAELRGITLALQLYQDDTSQELPPTRESCSSRSEFELPIELIPYLPANGKSGLDIVEMEDSFTGSIYKYCAPGDLIRNESILQKNRSRLWVPNDFPNDFSAEGQYFYDPDISPAKYAVWSEGPDLDSTKFEVNKRRRPIPEIFWLTGPNDTGVITHFADSTGQVHKSY